MSRAQGHSRSGTRAVGRARCPYGASTATPARGPAPRVRPPPRRWMDRAPADLPRTQGSERRTPLERGRAYCGGVGASGSPATDREITVCPAGDVMLGRGIDQVLPHPGDPRLAEPWVTDARAYVEMAEAANGPIHRPTAYDRPWGDLPEELRAIEPDAWVLNLETSVTRAAGFAPGKSVHYRMSPANLPCLAAARPAQWDRPRLRLVAGHRRRAGRPCTGCPPGRRPGSSIDPLGFQLGLPGPARARSIRPRPGRRRRRPRPRPLLAPPPPLGGLPRPIDPLRLRRPGRRLRRDHRARSVPRRPPPPLHGPPRQGHGGTARAAPDPLPG